MGRQPPSLSAPGSFESSPHLKVFHWVLEHCLHKFCAEPTIMLLSSGNEVAGKQTLKYKGAD